MSKASESKLAALHGAVAEVLTAQVSHKEELTTFDEEGNEVATGQEVYSATPATMAAAIKFLKDNSITCDVETNKNMNNLKEVLDKKQKNSARLESAQAAAQSIQH